MSQDALVGKRLDRYEIKSVLAQRRLATTYRAYEPGADRVVAIKVLSPAFSRSQAFLIRFEQETRLISRLEHAQIVPVLGAGQFQSLPYIAFRYMTGGSLAELLTRYGSLTPAEAVPLIEPVALALSYAHQRGVLHRNIKPGNILLDDRGNSYLADFSIPCVRQASAALLGLPVGGTPAYLAPEVARGERELTPATDSYGLGVVLFEMLAGCTPFQADQPADLIRLQAEALPPSPRDFNPGLPPQVAAVVTRALAKDPRERYPQPLDLAQALAEAAGVQPGARLTAARAGGDDREAPHTPRPTPTPALTRPILREPLPAAGQTPPPERADTGAVRADTSQMSRREQRRVARQVAAEQRRQARARRRAARGHHWYTVLLAILLLLVAWFSVGMLAGIEARRQINSGLLASIHATQTPAAATAFVQSTATIAAYLEDLAAATQAVLAGEQTATASVPTGTPEPTLTEVPTLTPSPTPYGGSRSLIAYVSERDGDPDIFVLDLETGAETRLTDNTVLDGWPVWSPDGRQIAYVSEQAASGQQVYLIDIGCLDAPGGCPGTERQLTSGIRTNLYPVWSADGSRIAYVSRESARQWLRTVTPEGGQVDLFQIPGDVRLFDWSPDGRLFTFFGSTLDGGGFDIMQVPFDGISTDRVPRTRVGGSIEFVDFSPDRSQVVFSRAVGARRQLYLADAACEYFEECVIRRLTDDVFTYLTPRFSPDGSLILVTSNRAGPLDLYILDLEGEIVQRLTRDPYDQYQGSWQPGSP